MLQLPQAAQACQQVIDAAHAQRLAPDAYTDMMASVAEILSGLDSLLSAGESCFYHAKG